MVTLHNNSSPHTYYMTDSTTEAEQNIFVDNWKDDVDSEINEWLSMM